MIKSLLPSTAVLLSCCVACSSQEEGTIRITAYGESFIEDGIPAENMDDGWDIRFDRFLVTFREVAVAGTTLSELEPADLTEASEGEGQELGRVLAPEGDYTDGQFTIGRLQVRGEATKGSETKTFDWVFDVPTRYAECETTTSVVAGEPATFQATIHADHLFFDSLVSEQPRLLFGPLADADADEDGEVTDSELAATDIGSYDPGSEDGTDDLWTWLEALVTTVGHVDGEGHCRATAVD